MSKSKMYAIEEIKPVIEEIVEQKLIELLGNPDSGLELRTQVRKRLELSLRAKKKGISAKKVAEELRLKW